MGNIICLFVYVPVNNISVTSGRDGSSWVELVLSKVTVSRTQHSDAGEARSQGPSVSSQALYHWATALPIM